MPLIDIRATDTTWARFTPTTSFGPDWDTNYPVNTGDPYAVATGFRFQLNVPQGATINSATFTAYQNQNSTWTSPADDRTLGAEQVDSSVQATDNADAQSRSANLGTTHTWANTGSILNSEPVPTGNIAAVIQEIVNRPGWTSGNYITLWATHPGAGAADQQLRSTVGVPTDDQPRLEVDYTSDATAPTVAIDQIHGSGIAESVTDSSGYAGETDTLTVSGTAADTGGSGLDVVEVRVDGGSWQIATGTTSWSIDLDVTAFPTGSFAIEARAKDGAGNVSTIASETVWHSPSGVWGASGSPGNHLAPLEISGYSS